MARKKRKGTFKPQRLGYAGEVIDIETLELMQRDRDQDMERSVRGRNKRREW